MHFCNRYRADARFVDQLKTLRRRAWQLLLSGVGTVEACRQVGIGRKTGYRWRAENGGVPPVRLADAGRSNR
ncbi:MAG TPA: helix-turn-helix domain-containing protein, partial [Actinomycetota bacterium]|nr:helix-turn-helix domain-containing protein [Actinomycetota bacterium]